MFVWLPVSELVSVTATGVEQKPPEACGERPLPRPYQQKYLFTVVSWTYITTVEQKGLPAIGLKLRSAPFVVPPPGGPVFASQQFVFDGVVSLEVSITVEFAGYEKFAFCELTAIVVEPPGVAPFATKVWVFDRPKETTTGSVFAIDPS